MTYSVQRFGFTSGSGGAGTYFADQINQFLTLNPTISPTNLLITWRYGRSRGQDFYLTLVYRGGSVPIRSWCAQFQSTPTVTAEAQATAFFTANPTYLPILSQVVSRPGIVTTSRRLLVIFATSDNAQPVCVRQAIVAAPMASVAVGAWANMYDPSDFSRPPVPVLNMGNAAWPAGGVNMAFSEVGNNPDLCSFAGVAPSCFAGSTFTTPSPSTPTLLCGGCFPPDFITLTSTGTLTSTSSTSTSTSTSTTSTSTSTTSTSTTTTSTTTTLTTTTTTSTSTSTTTTTVDPCVACGLGNIQPNVTITGETGACAAQNGSYAFALYNSCEWVWDLGGDPTLEFLVIRVTGNIFSCEVSNNAGQHWTNGSAPLACTGGFLTGTVVMTGGAGCVGGSGTLTAVLN